MSPQLATATCARRLQALGVDLEPPEAAITWYGPARLPPERPASEACVQALCGLMEVNGRDRGFPRRLGLEAASVAAGLLAAQGTLAAAIAAERGGRAPAMHTSVLQAGLLLLSHYFVVATGLGDAVPGPPLPAPGPPFRSADGRWFEIETLDAERWKAFWSGLGAGDADLGRAWTLFRWRYERARCSLPARLHEVTAAQPLAALTGAARDAGISLAPLRSYAEVLAEPGLAAGRPFLRPVPTNRPGPAPPRHAPADLPLAGFRVVEATSRIQGPFAGMLLRMLGADVTRVRPPEGDYGRAAHCLHRGKQTVGLDLGTPQGRGGLVDLVAGADVFLHNWRPGKAEEWGLDAATLTRHQPRLVYATASGWGDGPQARRLLGTDFLVQAATGLGQALNPEGDPPFPSRVILCDLFGALAGTEAVLAALLRRQREGGAWDVRSSLLAGAMALQSHVLSDVAAGKEIGRRNGRPVWGPLDRPVPTRAGPLVVSADDDDAFVRLCEVCGTDPAGGARASLERRLAARLAEGTAAEWEAALLAAGVPCAVAFDDLAAVPADPRFSHLFEAVAMGGVAPTSPWSFR